MDGDTSAWASVVQWVLGNPEKTALFLVFIAGIWSYVREVLRTKKDDDTVSDFTQMLLQENRELREELKLSRRTRKRKETDCSDEQQ